MSSPGIPTSQHINVFANLEILLFKSFYISVSSSLPFPGANQVLGLSTDRSYSEAS